MKKILLSLAGVLLLLAVIMIVLALRSGPQFPPVPNPNAYDAVVELAAGLPQVATNGVLSEEQIDRLFAAMEHPFVVPIEPTIEWAERHLDDVGHLRRLAVTANNNVDSMKAADEIQRAIALRLGLLQIGHDLVNTGVMIDQLVGLMIWNTEVQWLKMEMWQLDAGEGRRLLTRLKQLDSKTIAPSDLGNNEAIWVGKSHPFHKRIFIPKGQLEPVREKLHQDFLAAVRAERELMILLAARLHELKSGTPSVSISELVPAYLDAVPLDPATGEPVELPYFDSTSVAQ